MGVIMKSRIIGIATVLAIPLITFLILSFAGSLDPPGDPGWTMKTLDQMEPRRPIHASDLPLSVTSSGSYYLAENIPDATGGITVSKGNLEFFLDLNGFTLGGAVGNGTTGVASSFTVGCSIVNGTIEGWEVRGAQVSRCVVDGVMFRNNNEGIYANNSIIKNSIAKSNTESGFYVGDSGLIVDSVSFYNGVGIRLMQGSVARGCTASHNISNGIFIDTGHMYNRIEGNQLFSNDVGILILGTDNIIFGNSAFNNDTANYDIITGNDVGPIGQAATATSPWANFTN
jgi:parallel beta-helix repeat protein